ncbi:MAG: energy-coupling factor ABC transporter permease [Lautropia sp.]|nr:energy-coupling factor ABC transporter permease [Lautropia sp.]
MHIEIGILSEPKLTGAAVAAAGLLVTHARPLFTRPANLLRTLLAAVFFSILMQLWHMPVGPSELHLVGAMPIYLLFGYVPTLFGFALGLFLQAVLFEPGDLVHLAVNFLSLAVPLVVVHHTLGKRLARLTLPNVLSLDAVYYTGVTLMVGFWLSISADPAPVADWASFAASYLLLVAVEPFLTIALVLLGRRFQPGKLQQLSFDESWHARVSNAA